MKSHLRTAAAAAWTWTSSHTARGIKTALTHALPILAIAVASCVETTATGPWALANSNAHAALLYNEWQVWPLVIGPSACNQGFASGSVDVHLVSTSKTWLDGVATIRENLNVRNARLSDAAGNEYVFSRNPKYQQVTQLAGTYVVDVTETFRLISKGNASNEFIEIVVRIEWTGSQLVVTSGFLSTCKG